MEGQLAQVAAAWVPGGAGAPPARCRARFPGRARRRRPLPLLRRAAERGALRKRLEPLERGPLDDPGTVGGDAERLADLRQRVRALARQAEAQLQHAALEGREAVERVAD